MARLSASRTSALSNGQISVQSPSPSSLAALPTSPSEDATALKTADVGGDNGDHDDDGIEWPENDAIDTNPVPMDDSLYPGGTRDLSSIGLQAFILGNVASFGLLAGVYLIQIASLWWRLPAFFSVLALFHFLEYYTQARYNTEAIRADSFLLFSNGREYTTAHFLAAVEATLSCIFPAYGQAFISPYSITLGFALVAVGQIVRSLAMAQAGVSFNHVIARERKETHKLVTHGLYSIFRHPSYFGFFWFATGTQLLLGNKVCLVGYVIVLWQFFSRRIYGMYRLDDMGMIY